MNMNVDKQIYFEQYKLFVDSAEHVSDKRMSANNYFLTINTALVSMIGLSISSDFFSNQSWFVRIISLMGILICLIWFFVVVSHKQLNTGKYQLIHKLEKKLPIKLFDEEWEILGSGKNLWKYLPLSHVEMGVPILFGLLYVILLF